MQSYTKEQLLKLNKIGLIPGPLESSEEFTRRADYCLHLKQSLLNDEKDGIFKEGLEKGLVSAEAISGEILDEANVLLSKKYDIAPKWIPLFFSNLKLPLWQGGAAWIFQMKEDSPTGALVQLRKKFGSFKKYLWIYDRHELLTHELCHVGRMKFEEPKYEEILAYRTSPSKFRRLFGPIFQSSIESFIFLMILFIIVAIDFFLVSTGRHEGYALAFGLKMIPVCLVLAAVFRLFKRKRNIEGCLKNLEGVFEKQHAEAVLYRLTDEEIDLFSKKSPEFIKQYISDKSLTELRMEVIVQSYN